MEQLGQKAKTWLVGPYQDLWLFKHVRTHADGSRQPEDVAEWLAAAVAGQMGLPHAHVHLASRATPGQDRRGIIALHVSFEHDPLTGRPRPRGRLTHGDELLERSSAGYPAGATGAVPGYTPGRVLAVLEHVAAHPDLAGTALGDAGRQFVGYLAFDALINATDRHHQNWGVLEDVEDRYLVETYDHGSSFGLQERPDVKRDRLDDRHPARVTGWMKHGRTKFEGQPTPLEVALLALRLVPMSAVADIRERVAAVTPQWLDEVTARSTEGTMSQVDRNFAVEVVRVARKELLDADL